MQEKKIGGTRRSQEEKLPTLAPVQAREKMNVVQRKNRFLAQLPHRPEDGSNYCY
jgi:hypothetical protein